MARIPAYRITEAQWLTIIGAGTQVPNALYFVEINTWMVRIYETDNATPPNPRVVASMRHRGAYNAGTDYLYGDVVEQDGSSWFCKVETSTGNAPPSLPTTSNTQWELLAKKGTDGVGSGGYGLPVGGDTGQGLFKASDTNGDVAWVNPGYRNHLINGEFAVAQNGSVFDATTTPANNDDTYLLDQWILLSDGNDVVDVSQNMAQAPSGGLYCAALEVETANKKFGFFQPLEQLNCVGLIGGAVALSFKAKVSSIANLDNIKAAIVAHDGTADSITSDIVSAWGAEDTNPTLAANWTYENTPANLNVTTDWATFSITPDIDTANAKNLGVFIWSDVTETSIGDILYLADAQLAPGSVALPFKRRSISEELALCYRYLYVTTIFGGTGIAFNTSQIARFTAPLPTPMRVAPTATFSGSVGFFNGAATGALSAINTQYSTQSAFQADLTCSGTPWTAGDSVVNYDAGAAKWKLSAQL